jgi:maleylacetoacetate isomerase
MTVQVPVTEVVLYDYWRSSASYRVRIALGLKGVPFARVPVDLVAGAQRTPVCGSIRRGWCRRWRSTATC